MSKKQQVQQLFEKIEQLIKEIQEKIKIERDECFYKLDVDKAKNTISALEQALHSWNRDEIKCSGCGTFHDSIEVASCMGSNSNSNSSNHGIEPRPDSHDGEWFCPDCLDEAGFCKECQEDIPKNIRLKIFANS